MNKNRLKHRLKETNMPRKTKERVVKVRERGKVEELHLVKGGWIIAYISDRRRCENVFIQKKELNKSTKTMKTLDVESVLMCQHGKTDGVLLSFPGRTRTPRLD